jgi:2-polyprenyl-3-methyl-5-hydroxy-6-metoxy-1,4-benzoquinol methylase
MTTGISDNYRGLTAAESTYDSAWQDSAIPERQYRRVVVNELEWFRAGGDVLPYRVALECLRMLPLMGVPSLLDVGASSGYYSEVFRIGGYPCRYTALDYSDHFREIAERLYPGIDFKVGDATALPFDDGQFDIVFHSAVIMHVRGYEKAIFEAARVAKNYVIFHRTPIDESGTTYWTKDAYDTPCLEVHFDPEELLEIFSSCGLSVIHSVDFGMRTYVLAKDALVHHRV